MATNTHLDLMAFAQGAELANRANWADAFNQQKFIESQQQSDWRDKFNTAQLQEAQRQAGWSDKINEMNLATQQAALERNALTVGWATENHDNAKALMDFSAKFEADLSTKYAGLDDLSRADAQARDYADAIRGLDPADPLYAQKFAALQASAQRKAAMLQKQNPEAASKFLPLLGASNMETMQQHQKQQAVTEWLSGVLQGTPLAGVPQAAIPTALMLMQQGMIKPAAAPTPAVPMSAAPGTAPLDLSTILAGGGLGLPLPGAMSPQMQLQVAAARAQGTPDMQAAAAPLAPKSSKQAAVPSPATSAAQAQMKDAPMQQTYWDILRNLMQPAPASGNSWVTIQNQSPFMR